MWGIYGNVRGIAEYADDSNLHAIAFTEGLAQFDGASATLYVHLFLTGPHPTPYVVAAQPFGPTFDDFTAPKRMIVTIAVTARISATRTSRST